MVAGVEPGAQHRVIDAGLQHPNGLLSSGHQAFGQGNTGMQLSRKFGPGILVTAAFIGPGTITTASSAGAHFGFALMWALVFSIFATIVLQEMAARLGLVTRAGLAEAMRQTFSSPIIGKGAVLLVVAAIVLATPPTRPGISLEPRSPLPPSPASAPVALPSCLVSWRRVYSPAAIIEPWKPCSLCWY